MIEESPRLTQLTSSALALPRQETTPAIAIDGLWWRYPIFGDSKPDTPHPWTLRDITLQIRQGECFGLTGPGGAGKTTLCRALSGIIPQNTRLTAEQLPSYFRGSIKALGEVVSQHTSANQTIGMVLQDPENQFLRMSLLHELSLGLQLQQLPQEEILLRAYDALCRVGLSHLWHGAAYIHPADLSGGQKQRVAIAAFLALRPRILILDEPTSDLDPQGKRAVIETITRLRQQYAMTIILVEQDPDLLATFCDRIALLHEGRIELIASPGEFYAQRAILERSGASIGEMTRISWASGYTYQGNPPLTLAEGCETFAPTLLRTPPPPPIPPTKTSEHTVVQARNLHYQYSDGSQALKGIDFSLYQGEMLALLGPNGSGKTTFAKILAGIYQASQGDIQVLGQNLASRKARAGLPRHVGYVFQNPDHQLFCRKVRDEIAYGLKNLGFNAQRRTEITQTTLEAVDLAPFADEDPLFLSKGQRQRLAVAAVLAMGADILIVDEPTTGQDHRSITAIMQLLSDLQRQGKSILIITHDMTLVAEHCQRAVAFHDGHITFNGTPAELFTSPDILRQTGLCPPLSADLSNSLRDLQPGLPPLLTVKQWVEALKGTRTEEEHF